MHIVWLHEICHVCILFITLAGIFITLLNQDFILSLLTWNAICRVIASPAIPIVVSYTRKAFLKDMTQE